MKKSLGKVIEVFIPEQYKNGMLLDVMDRTIIGFKVMTEEGIKEVICDADEFSSNIYKGNTVMITEQTITGHDFIDIELYDEDIDE